MALRVVFLGKLLFLTVSFFTLTLRAYFLVTRATRKVVVTLLVARVKRKQALSYWVLFTQVYKWVPANLMLGVTLQMIRIPS